MVADWYDGFVLESEWTTPGEGAAAGRYRLILSNHGGETLSGFRLGLSGPARISDGARVTGGSVAARLSNYAELVPAPGFALAPGASWTVEVEGLDYPIRHWTDGATAGFVIRADGGAEPALTLPTRLNGSGKERKRGTMPASVPAEPPVPVSIIPWPAAVAVSGRGGVPPGFAISAGDQAGEAAEAAFKRLTGLLFGGEGLVRPFNEGGFAVILKPEPGLPSEGYRLHFEAERVIVEATTAKGYLYGLITLGQMQRGARLHPQSFSFPAAGRIEDAPLMGWRGCHLDVARRFYAREELERFLAVLSWNKLNVFHWHLSDDEGWRVEIEVYPELTARAAWRGHGMDVPPLLGSGPERSGGYYSKDDIRALVALGEQLGVEIVPEIDVPGHCYAMLQAMPQLRDPGESGTYHSIQSFPNNCLNPAVEGVYDVIEAIFSEMIELFPSRHFHIGADEVPEGAWAGSPMAQALGQRLGTRGAAPLQAHFLKRIQAFLSSKGRITGAWEEAGEGGGIDRQDCYLVGWRTAEASQKLAAEGYDVVIAPGQAYYLDMANSADWHEPGAAWAGWSSPEKAYRFEPAAGWSDAERTRLLGVQACIWSEPMSDRAVFDRLVFPRLSAIAEAGWTAQARRDYGRFSALVGLMPNLYGRFEGA